jgi:hypothetical protein
MIVIGLCAISIGWSIYSEWQLSRKNAAARARTAETAAPSMYGA